MSQTIEVLIRVRPPTQASSAVGEAVVTDEVASKVCVPRIKNKGHAEFTFTKVFGPQSDQKTVYSGCDVTTHVLQGVSCCVMTYGQTNTGKTYTMYGNGWDEPVSNPSLQSTTALGDADSNDSGDEGSVFTANAEGTFATAQSGQDHLGIVPRCISDLFDALEQKTATVKNCHYSVSKYPWRYR
jgi:hypothetical protein